MGNWVRQLAIFSTTARTTLRGRCGLLQQTIVPPQAHQSAYRLSFMHRHVENLLLPNVRSALPLRVLTPQLPRERRVARYPTAKRHKARHLLARHHATRFVFVVVSLETVCNDVLQSKHLLVLPRQEPQTEFQN